MTLYTVEDFNRNLEARVSTINLIDSLRKLAEMHRNAGRNALAKNVTIRLAEAEFQLHMLNKDYDEMLTASTRIEIPARKSFIKKLLRK